MPFRVSERAFIAFKRFQTAKTALSPYICRRQKCMGMKTVSKLFVGAAVAAAAAACNPEHFFGMRGEKVDTEGTLAHGMVVLGERLEDPYSVKNITKALESLYPTKAGTIDVSTTDLYVRFLPDGQDQLDMLESLGLEMLDHPMDYAIVREGDWYHDPAVPEENITWQYCVVPPDFEFPANIRYEIIDRCHITEHDVISRAGSTDIDWEAVEREAFRLTGNEAMLEDVPFTRGGEAARPSGRITVVDGRFPSSEEGVKGVRVACNVFVKIGQAYTDADGYYQINKSFSSKPRYRLVFKNSKGFGIGLNLILVGGSVSTMGKSSPQGYSKVITSSDDRSMFSRCVVNNAVWDYYEGCKTSVGSIDTPPSNLRLWIFQGLDASSTVMMHHGVGIDNTKIGETLKKYLGDFAPLVKWFLPDITLGLKGRTDYASIYGVTVHELAHASHYRQVGKAWWDKLVEYILVSYVTSGMQTYGNGGDENAGYCEVAEMWGYYMQSKLYRLRYPDGASMFGTSWWFSPQILMYLDNKGLNRFSIFKALMPAVTDRGKLQEKLLSLYGDEFKTQINTAFNRYL